VKDAAKEIKEKHNEINWRIAEKDRKQVSLMIEGVGHVNTMEDIAMMCANICGVQLAIVDVSVGKPLLYQFAWKVIKFIKNKKTKNWMCNNSDCIAHLPMIFMEKIPQFFNFLHRFLQNSINTNKIEVANDKFDIKIVTIAVKLASKFFSKMQKHIYDNSIPKDVPAFARSFFSEALGGRFTLILKGNDAKKSSTAQSADGAGGGKRKPNGKENKGRRSPEKSFWTRASRWACSMSKRGLLPPKHCLISAH
jgi:hypothetical protein